MALVLLLVSLVGQRPSRFASSKHVRSMDLATYSIYLTHPLMIHASRALVDSVLGLPWFAYFGIAPILIVAVGAGFHVAIERTSIQVRDRLVTRRERRSAVVS